MVLLVPLAVLGIDLYLFPLLFSRMVIERSAGLVDVLQKQAVELGVFRAHHLYVSIDDIADPQYLSLLPPGATALVISAYIAGDGTQTNADGALLGAVLSRLRRLSSEDHIRLTDELAKLRKPSNWQVTDLALHVPASNFRSFPVDHLLIVALPEGHPDPKNLQAALAQALTVSQRKRLANVIVPTLAVRWDDHGKNALSPSDFFDTFFGGLPVADHPDRIYLSLYKSWPTFQLEETAEALNTRWKLSVSDAEGDYVLYRREIRLVLCALVICLLACSFSATYTLKNFVIIALSFVTLGFSAGKWVAPLVVEQGAGAQLLVQIVILVVLAIAFPIIVTWNPKEVFDKDKPQHG